MPDQGAIAACRNAISRGDVRRCVAAILTGLGLLGLAVRAEITTIRPEAGGTPLLLAEPRPAAADWPGYRGVNSQGQVPGSLAWLTASSSTLLPNASGNPLPRGRLATAEGLANGSATPGSTGSASLVTNSSGVIPAEGGRASGNRICGTPCIWGRYRFELEQPQLHALWLCCYETTSGERLWRLPLKSDESFDRTTIPQDHEAAFTPVCDGQAVFVPTVADGELWLTSVSFEGELAWCRPVGPYTGSQAYRVSPVIAGPLVILSVDQAASPLLFWQKRSYVVGVHRLTGELVWRRRRPNGESFGTPVVATVSGRQQLIIPGCGQIISYQPASGEPLWSCRWMADKASGGVVTDDEHVYAASLSPQGEILCIRADGNGDVTSTRLVWRNLLPDGDAGSLVLASPLLINQQRNGAIVAFDKATGRSIWRVRLPAALSSPPLMADRQLICLDDRGILHVLDADRRGETLFETELGAAMPHSLIAAGGSLQVRSRTGQWQLDKPAAGESPSFVPVQIAIEPRQPAAR